MIYLTFQRPVLTSCTSRLNIKKFCILPTEGICVLFTYIRKTVIIFLYSNKWMVIVTKGKVYCAVRNGSLMTMLRKPRNVPALPHCSVKAKGQSRLLVFIVTFRFPHEWDSCKRWSFWYTLFVASAEGRRLTILGFLQQKVCNTMKNYKQKVSFNKTEVRRMEYVQLYTETFSSI